MNEEEIKKFAKQCVMFWEGLEENVPSIEDMEDYKSVVSALRLLQNNYCIVPKEKVTELYDCGFTGLSGKQTRSILKYIFGKELFEQKGE